MRKFFINNICCLVLGAFSMVAMAQDTAPSDFDISQAKLRDTQAAQFLKDYRFNKAIARYTEAIELDAKADYYLHRAEAYLEYDKISKSKNDFYQALQVDSLMGLAYLGMARCLIAENEDGDSLQYYLDNALHHCNKNKEQAMALKTLAQIKMNKGEYEVADNYIVAANRLNPENVEINILMASIEFELGNQEEAIVILEEIVKNNRNNINYLINLGYLYNAAERYDEALKVLNRA